jgi:hypothetical protein
MGCKLPWCENCFEEGDIVSYWIQNLSLVMVYSCRWRVDRKGYREEKLSWIIFKIWLHNTRFIMYKSTIINYYYIPLGMSQCTTTNIVNWIDFYLKIIPHTYCFLYCNFLNFLYISCEIGSYYLLPSWQSLIIQLFTIDNV